MVLKRLYEGFRPEFRTKCQSFGDTEKLKHDEVERQRDEDSSETRTASPQARCIMTGTVTTQILCVLSVAPKAAEPEHVGGRHGVVNAKVTHTKTPRAGVETDRRA